MNTLLNILFGFLLFIFVSVSIVLISGWLIMQIMYDRVNQDDCGCSSCDCDDEPKINDFSKKTKVSGMGGVGGPIDVIRGKSQTPTNEPREENDPNPTQK
jgi:hypothetical protein